MTPRADVDAIFLAHQISPGESLAVRLLGTVGPDSSWSLLDVQVRAVAGKVLLLPRVRRTAGLDPVPEFVLFDRIVHLLLPPGRHVVEALGRQGHRRETVVVASGFRRPAPTTEVRVAPSPIGQGVRVELAGIPGDGFVARLDWRVVALQKGRRAPTRSGSMRWHAAMGARVEGAGLRAWLELGVEDGARIEARAVDGQGTADPNPATANLLQP